MEKSGDYPLSQDVHIIGNRTNQHCRFPDTMWLHYFYCPKNTQSTLVMKEYQINPIDKTVFCFTIT